MPNDEGYEEDGPIIRRPTARSLQKNANDEPRRPMGMSGGGGMWVWTVGVMLVVVRLVYLD